MFSSFLIGIGLLSAVNVISPTPQAQPPVVVAEHVMPLDDRYPVKSVSDVFKDNILLTLAYLRGTVKDGSKIDWTDVEKPFTYSFTLQPGQVFAFHQDVLPQYAGEVAVTTHAHFNSTDGFKSDGYLVGDGVCHLASLFNWVGKESGLETVAPTNHDFAVIPDVPKKFGAAIYFDPGSTAGNAQQNVYIKNTRSEPVTFVITYKNDVLTLDITQAQ